MAIGDTPDVVFRLRSVLPTGWFGDEGTTPVLDSILTSFATAFSWCYALLQFVVTQARLKTSTGVFIDMWAASWFGSFPRESGETDAAYIARIEANLFLVQGTRPAFINAMDEATGQAPALIVEPMNATDTKGIGSIAEPACGGGYGLNEPGLYVGSLLLPGQFFTTQSIGASGMTAAQIYTAERAAVAAGITAWSDVTA